jgi:hypothetical protein
LEALFKHPKFSNYSFKKSTITIFNVFNTQFFIKNLPFPLKYPLQKTNLYFYFFPIRVKWHNNFTKYYFTVHESPSFFIYALKGLLHIKLNCTSLRLTHVLRLCAMVVLNLTLNKQKQSNGVFRGCWMVRWMREMMKGFNTIETCTVCHASLDYWLKQGACNTRGDKARGRCRGR